MTTVLVVPPQQPVVVFTGVDRFRAAWRHGQPGPIPSTAAAAAASFDPPATDEGAAATGAVSVGVHATATAVPWGSAPPSTSARVPNGTARPAAPTTSSKGA